MHRDRGREGEEGGENGTERKRGEKSRIHPFHMHMDTSYCNIFKSNFSIPICAHTTECISLGRSSGTHGSIHLLYESTGKEGGELEASEVGLSSQCGLNQAPCQRGGMEGEL